MKIGVDISQIVYPGTGVARYLNNMIDAIVKYDHNNQYCFFFSSLRKKIPFEIEKKIGNKHLIKKFFFPPTLLDLIWNQIHIISIEKFVGQVDLFVTSDWTEPPSKNKKITVIHDLVYLTYPETLDKKIIEVQKRRIEWVKKESSLIIADSLATKNDIVRKLNISPKKIKVIYPAVNIDPIPDANFTQKTLNKYSLTKPFILTVGKIEPRKNLKRLISAFYQAKIKNLNLVIVGPKGWDKDNFSNCQNIRFLGYIPDQELFSLYQSALFFIYPSLYEGFGYPLVEAMILGCPVATSNTSSLKEIAEGYGLLFNPIKEEEITKAIIKLQQKRLREDLKKRGLVRAKQFSLENYAKKLINTFESQKFN